MKKFEMPKLPEYDSFEEFQVECARVRWQNADSDSRDYYFKEYKERKDRFEAHS